jgi:hypothetical protein
MLRYLCANPQLTTVDLIAIPIIVFRLCTYVGTAALPTLSTKKRLDSILFLIKMQISRRSGVKPWPTIRSGESGLPEFSWHNKPKCGKNTPKLPRKYLLAM